MTLIRIITTIVAAAAAMVFSTATYAQCTTEGGKDLCTDRILGRKSQFMCDDVESNIHRLRIWCEVSGGEWNGETATCQGPTPMNDGNVQDRAGAFMDRYHGPKCGSAPPKEGCSNWHCTCNEQKDPYTGETLVSSSIFPYSGKTADGQGNCVLEWAENVIWTTVNSLDCPAGYRWTGGRYCVKFPPSNNCVGNPVEVCNGDKRQREVDYTSPAPGGLQFVRYYNSGGYFANVRRPDAVTDYWRHSYSAQIVAYEPNAYAMAAVLRPDGNVRSFALSGVEIGNNDGAAYRLQKVLDGSGTQIGWQLTTAESDVETYDLQGRLASIVTRPGYVTTLGYDASGRLSTISDTFGRSIVLGYNAEGLLSTMTDPASRVYQYGYDTDGRLASVTYPGLQTRTYLYEDTKWKHALTGIITERGYRLSTYAYDSQGRANLTEHAGSEHRYSISRTEDSSTVNVTALDGFGTANSYVFAKIGGTVKLTSHGNLYTGSERWTYTADGDPLTKTDRRNFVTSYVYDPARHLEISRTEAQGQAIARTITTTWHPTYRLPVTITEPSGVAGVSLVTEFTYDAAGNLVRKKLTAGTLTREWNYTVNSRGQVLTIDGPRTDVSDLTTMTYYADSDPCTGCRGQLHTVTNAAGQVTTFSAYDADGRPGQVTDANGVATSLGYTPRGWLASRAVAGETTSYEYDGTGNLTKVTQPDGSWISYTYDSANGLIGIDDSAGNAIDYELDVFGNRVAESVYDPQMALRRMLQRVYDAVNRLQKDLGADGQTTQYGYDGNGNVTTVTDDYGRVTTNTYDALNRLTRINDAAGGNTDFTYDAKDRLATVKDPKLSATTGYTYNGLGDLVTQVSPDTGTTSFTYDAAGNVTTRTDARSVATTYAYDVLNRVTSATVTDGTVTYEYDNVATGGAYARGRLTRVTDPSGSTAYAYDALGRVTSKVQMVTATPTDRVFTVGYGFAAGRQTGLTYPSGRVVSYGFNSAGQVSSVTVDGVSILASGEYAPFGAVRRWVWGNGQVMERSYDLDGRVSSLTLGPSTGTYADLGQLFGYDSLMRLTSANLAAGQSQSFVYDANSNRTSHAVNASTTTYAYPATSHKLSSLSGATTRSFTYDNAGNVTASAGVSYVYDGRGRMKQAGTVAYLVNGLGQRVKKAAGTEIFFVYDEAGRLLGEYDVTGVPIQETVWLGDLPVAVVKPKTGGFDVFYVWADHLGTPRLISDAANQPRWEWPHSDPFGNNAPDENPVGAGVFAFNLRFPGQYFDAETGKHYNYHRDYDPAIGRYLQSDPIGLDGGLSTFAYAGSNALTHSDFYGLDYWVEGASPGESGMGQHQSICVGKRGGNRSCISFGRKPSEGNCLFDCKGHIYRDRSAEGPLYRDYHRTTPPQVDAKIKKDFDKMLGEQGRWDVLGGKNCRVFSQDTFENLVNKYGGGTGGGR